MNSGEFQCRQVEDALQRSLTNARALAWAQTAEWEVVARGVMLPGRLGRRLKGFAAGTNAARLDTIKTYPLQAARAVYRHPFWRCLAPNERLSRIVLIKEHLPEAPVEDVDLASELSASSYLRVIRALDELVVAFGNFRVCVEGGDAVRANESAKLLMTAFVLAAINPQIRNGIVLCWRLAKSWHLRAIDFDGYAVVPGDDCFADIGELLGEIIRSVELLLGRQRSLERDCPLLSYDSTRVSLEAFIEVFLACDESSTYLLADMIEESLDRVYPPTSRKVLIKALGRHPIFVATSRGRSA